MTTIEFLQLYHIKPNADTPAISTCLESLVGNTHIFNNQDFSRDLALIELPNGVIGGLFRKVRPDDGIEYGQAGGQSKPLELADDEGIFESNHFAYFPQYNIIAYIRNRHANTHTQLRECLKSLLGKRIGMTPMLQKSSIEALLFKKNVVEISCSMPVSSLFVYDGNMWSNQALSALSQSGANTVDFTVKIDRRKQNGWLSNTMENINNMMGLGANKLTAKVKDLDGNEVSPIDFLANKILYIDQNFSYTKDKKDSQAIFQKIIDAYLDKLDEIEEVHRTCYMATY
ncbi:DUF6731 family protein [Moraxella sp. VT-16-12]|uniref:DUF6731 family protein n=1 Tax=Moraxella sp. VT-16-12 TaxID=2014877 RepID=UPI000B7EDC33|nr:DUF6731 family protein [Moraxella sp. VT-16-12]TWV80440.1 hypothetical protein CEW93_010155 [Moraxella sp. VT-16-12]